MKIISTPIQYRPALPEDKSGLLLLLREYYQEILSYDLEVLPLQERHSQADQLLERLPLNQLTGNYQYYLAVSGTNYLAFCLLLRRKRFLLGKKIAYIEAAYTVPSLRSRGVMKQLIHFIMSGDDRDADAWQLQVFLRNERAIHFWESLGFRSNSLVMEYSAKGDSSHDTAI